jgi:hypothetical protein
LFFGVVKQERFRFKVVDLVVIVFLLLAVDVNHTPGLQVLETHVGVPQLFFALFEGACEIALIIFILKIFQLAETSQAFIGSFGAVI